VWPVGDLEEGGHLRRGPAHDRGVGPVPELLVAHAVIAVAVGVGDNQREGGSAVGGQPVADEAVDGGTDLQAPGAGVEQQDPIAAKQQVEERRLETGLHRLADHEGVGVVALDLHLRLRLRGSVNPGLEEGAGQRRPREGQQQGRQQGGESGQRHSSR
jgi:hypothetical protein